MIQALLEGILVGLVLSALIGPVFFLLIRTSIEKGFVSALILDIGVVLGDIFCIAIAYFGLADIFQNPAYQKHLGIMGGSILIMIGLYPFFRKPKKSAGIETPDKHHPVKLILKGFILNITNPFVILFWVGTVGLAVSSYGTQYSRVFIYFTGCILSYLAIDILKIYLAHRIREYLSPQTFALINKIASLAIVGFGIILIYRVYDK